MGACYFMPEGACVFVHPIARPGAGERRALTAAMVIALSMTSWIGVLGVAAATPTDLFISEYVDGASNNKAIEIFNGTGSSVDLSAGGYAIQVYSNGATTATTTTPLAGMLASGDVFVVGNASADVPEILTADQLSAGINFNGNDAVVLRIGTSGPILDIIGQIGVDPGLGWGSGEQTTNDRTLVRKPTVSAGRTTNDAFDPATEWDAYPFATYSQLGSHLFDAGGGSSSGTVTADVTMAASAACLELSSTSISFGTLGFGAEDVPATPSLTVTNCATASGTLLASATDAAGTTASWTLVDSNATCADTLGVDTYRLNLQSADLAAPVSLGTTNKTVQTLAAGASTTHIPHIYTPCPGSSGDGETLTFQINYLATE